MCQSCIDIQEQNRKEWITSIIEDLIEKRSDIDAVCRFQFGKDVVRHYITSQLNVDENVADEIIEHIIYRSELEVIMDETGIS